MVKRLARKKAKRYTGQEMSGGAHMSGKEVEWWDRRG